MAKENLTGKQKRFCIEYLKDLNATKAAERAGYSKDTAFSIGWENLRKPLIKKYIDNQLDEAMTESKIMLKSRIIKELKDIAFSDNGIELLSDKDGNVYDVRITDKLKGIDMLGKYLAMWTEKIELSGNQEKPVLVSIADIMGKNEPST